MFELPIFPLNTVLFPGMPMRLHIFEDRYRLMMQHVINTNQTFGVSLIKTGTEAYGPLAVPYNVGCTARVVQVEPLEDGRFNLTVVGDERYQVLRMGSNEPYLMAFVESMPLSAHQNLDVLRGARLLRDRLLRYLSLLARHSELEGENLDVHIDLSHLELPDDPMMLIYLSAALLQLPANEKQPLLETNTAAALLDQVQRLYRRELAVLPALIDINEEDARSAAWAN